MNIKDTLESSDLSFKYFQANIYLLGIITDIYICSRHNDVKQFCKSAKTHEHYMMILVDSNERHLYIRDVSCGWHGSTSNRSAKILEYIFDLDEEQKILMEENLIKSKFLHIQRQERLSNKLKYSINDYNIRYEI